MGHCLQVRYSSRPTRRVAEEDIRVLLVVVSSSPSSSSFHGKNGGTAGGRKMDRARVELL